MTRSARPDDAAVFETLLRRADMIVLGGEGSGFACRPEVEAAAARRPELVVLALRALATGQGDWLDASALDGAG